MGSIHSKPPTVMSTISGDSGEKVVAIDEHVGQDDIPPCDVAIHSNNEDSMKEDSDNCLFYCIPGITSIFKSIPSAFLALPMSTAESISPSLEKQTNEQSARSVSVTLPVEIYTCIWEFLVDFKNGITLETAVADKESIAAFRLVNTTSKNAFTMCQGWILVGRTYKRQAEQALSKLHILDAERSAMVMVQQFLGHDLGISPGQAAKSLSTTRELQERVDHVRMHCLPNVNRLVKLYHNEQAAIAIDDNARMNYALSYEQEGDEWNIRFTPNATPQSITIRIGAQS